MDIAFKKIKVKIKSQIISDMKQIKIQGRRKTIQNKQIATILYLSSNIQRLIMLLKCKNPMSKDQMNVSIQDHLQKYLMLDQFLFKTIPGLSKSLKSELSLMMFKFFIFCFATNQDFLCKTINKNSQNMNEVKIRQGLQFKIQDRIIKKGKKQIKKTFAIQKMAQIEKPPQISLEQIQQSLLQNDGFIEQLKYKLSAISSLQVQSKIIFQDRKENQTAISSNLKLIKKDDLDFIIQQISAILNDLISQKLQYELNEIIEENNNVLLQIKQNLLLQQKENQSVLFGNKNILSQEQNKNEISFSDVHRLIAEEKKKFQGLNQNVSDADLQKSLSSLVDFKFQSIQEKVLNVDKRLKTMEDKYETNLKSIWNVLSMTQGAVFDFINKEKQKQKKESQMKQNPQEKTKKSQQAQKKTAFFKLW